MKVKEIEGLIEFIAKSGLEEVSIETDQIKLLIKKNAPFIQQIVPESPKTTSVMQADSGSAPLDHLSGVPQSSHIEFKSPMVGTFYQAPHPDAPPFVQVGDQIKPGQKLCVIEAMKLFNEIEADIEGTLVKILVDDAAPVEYDQPLFLIDP